MTKLVHDGVSLAHEDRGTGEPPIILVHGWTGDRSHLAPQARHFSRTHRVIAVDLRGHGESDRPRDVYSVDLFVEDLVWVCERLGLRRSALVGHSMGGNVVLELAARRPDLASAVVLLDAPVFPAAGLIEAMKAVAPAFRGPNYRNAACEFVSGVFLATDDRVRRSEILDKVSRCPQHVLSSAWEEANIGYDASAAAAACQIPVCYIGAAAPLADLIRFKNLCPQLIIGQTVGAGHFHQLEVPDQVNAMVERFLLTTFARVSTA